ncbi:putative high affinity immunoglobulin gamma Fc receptor IC [Alosa sapidissima]|uniref:putative high affinity immunoglobulin gamma Fc receptor IC n=1 Tax=Alosa sapidissima TaxID=34773 RepID=UPI001C08724F|nr:putative high affinity immunoglobulin gamma Fc receptor IC [Alosa sapidissima]
MSDQGEYMCYGLRESSGTYSPQSNTVQITVEELPLATVTVEPKSPVFTGETVTLKCVMESLSGWTYKWYKGSSRTPVSEGNTFTIRGAAESHKGQYWCQGERRDRPTASQPSRKITLNVKASKPKVTLSPDHQLLTGDSVTLRCELLGVSSGLVFYWYKDTQTSDPVAQTDGNSYSISSVKVSDGGQYWCRAGRGDPVFYTQYSDAVEIKCIEGDVILESPVHPVTEGDPLTLRCRYRYPSNISADFYKDGTLLQTSTTGEMTIPAVSKAHEGLYKCSNTERGESPESRVTVRVLDSGSSELVVEVGVVIRLLIAFALVILLAILLYHSYKVKGSGTVERNLDQQLQTTNQSRDPDQTTNQSSDPDQRTNQSSDRDQRNQIQSAGREGTQSEYMPLQKRSTDDYYTLTPLYMPLQKGTTDVYETIESSKDS